MQFFVGFIAAILAAVSSILVPFVTPSSSATVPAADQQPPLTPASHQSSSSLTVNVPTLPSVGTFHWVPVSQMGAWGYTIQGDQVYVRDRDFVPKLIPDVTPSAFFVGASYGPTETISSHDAAGTFYVTDGKQIYYLNDFEVSLQPLSGVDFSTFEALFNDGNAAIDIYYPDAIFARDSKHVYFDNIVLSDADPNTFMIVDDDSGDPTGYFKDSSHVWFHDYYSARLTNPKTNPQITLIPSADSATLTALPSDRIYGGNVIPTVAIDKYKVYDSGSIIDGADPGTFELFRLASFSDGDAAYPVYAKDATHVWSVTYATSSPDYGDFQLMVGADPKTFHLADPTICTEEESCPYDSLDKYHKYLGGQIIN
jgi:hypothetical protein